MALRSLGAIAVSAASAWCVVPAAWAQQATVRQAYQAAEAGKLAEAQALMDKVLRQHPHGGQAHVVEAVQNTTTLVARAGPATALAEVPAAAQALPAVPAPAAGSSGWTMRMVVGALIVASFVYWRNRASRQAVARRRGA